MPRQNGCKATNARKRRSTSTRIRSEAKRVTSERWRTQSSERRWHVTYFSCYNVCRRSHWQSLHRTYRSRFARHSQGSANVSMMNALIRQRRLAGSTHPSRVRLRVGHSGASPLSSIEKRLCRPSRFSYTTPELTYSTETILYHDKANLNWLNTNPGFTVP